MQINEFFDDLEKTYFLASLPLKKNPVILVRSPFFSSEEIRVKSTRNVCILLLAVSTCLREDVCRTVGRSAMHTFKALTGKK